jgi:chitinase
VNYLLESGASPDKLVLGVDFAGRTFTLADRNLHEIGSPSNGTGLQGPYTQTDGYLGYNEVCWIIFNNTIQILKIIFTN